MLAFRFTVCLLALLALTTAGCRVLNRSATGGIEVAQESPQAALPQALPSQVYVTDFQLDSAHFHPDEGARGLLPGLMHRPLAEAGNGMPTPLGSGDPAQSAATIVNGLAQDLTQELQAQGVNAVRLSGRQYGRPSQGWLIQGVFLDVDEGNRIKRAVMGFGKGSTQMEIQVSVSDLQSQGSAAPFAVFGTSKDASKMPGAIVSKNPYVAAAKFVLEKNATGKDVSNSAKQIAGEFMKLWKQVEQGGGHSGY